MLTLLDSEDIDIEIDIDERGNAWIFVGNFKDPSTFIGCFQKTHVNSYFILTLWYNWKFSIFHLHARTYIVSFSILNVGVHETNFVEIWYPERRYPLKLSFNV